MKPKKLRACLNCSIIKPSADFKLNVRYRIIKNFKIANTAFLEE